ncbi:hypothetical protein [Paenibacillus koleovorans]|uniref:hypothetical protein n=1 Tax=Paenibacillus koleovorans TaxID=121608 RepID=UPI000FD9B3ED|nr:hypothetical protein [Paenibacillus koleovorans]
MKRQDPEVTIYNYRLIRRIRHQWFWSALYTVLPVLGFLVVVLRYDLWTALWTPLGFLGLIWLHTAIAGIQLRYHPDRERSHRNWKLLIRFPWLGLLPEQPAPLRLILRLQTVQWWIGLACIGICFPWLPTVALFQLTIVHVWILTPTFWMLARFSRSGKYGLLKINPRETSYYAE